MNQKQIGFVGIQSVSDEVKQIDNGPSFEGTKTIGEIASAGWGYTWEGGYLYINVDEDAPSQTLNFVGLNPITSQDFFGGRPPTID